MKESPQDEKIQISLYVPPPLFSRIRDEAGKQERSINNLLVKTLKELFMPEVVGDFDSAESDI